MRALPNLGELFPRKQQGTSGLPRAERVAIWLSLAAAPTFALMALLTEVYGGGPADLLCSAVLDRIPFSGMTVMYLLMSVFHSAPWLRLTSRRFAQPQGA